MTPDVQLLAALHQLRRQWRQRQLLEALAALVVALLLATAAGWALFQTLGPGASTVTLVRTVGWLIVLAALARFAVWPLLRRTDDARFALYVEEHAPELRQSLVSALSEVTRPADARSSSALTARLARQVLTTLTPITRERRIERAPSARALQVSGAAVVVAVIALLGGPDSVRDMARLLFVPWTTAEAASVERAVRVEPGNTIVPRGGALDVAAALVNFDADAADLVFRPDSASEWVRLPMQRVIDSLAAEQRFTSRLFDVTGRTEYYVESDGIRSPVYTLTVSDMPAVRSITLELRYPAYTGMSTEIIDSSGDVVAVVGTTVRVVPVLTREARGGSLRFDDGTQVPLQADTAGALGGTFKVTKTGFYRIDLVAPDGRAVPGAVQYAVDAIPDRAPVVRIEEPGRDTKVTSLEEVTIAAVADDDFGVTKLELRFRVNGGDERRVALAQTGRRDARDLRVGRPHALPRGVRTRSRRPDRVSRCGARRCGQRGHERRLLSRGASVRPQLPTGRRGWRWWRRRWRGR